MKTYNVLGAVIGGGPKGISMLIQLQREFPNQFVGLESSVVVSNWDSNFAGTSPTRTGMYYSDTIIPGPDVPWNLVQFAQKHPAMTKSMFRQDTLPKEVLQDYYRMAASSANVNLLLGENVRSIRRENAQFRLLTDDTEVIAKYLIIATGPVNHKVWPDWAVNLSPDVCQHSIGHGIFENVRDQKLLLVGGGHATPDIACRMWELGANVVVVMRKPNLNVNYLPYPDRYIMPMYWGAYSHMTIEEKLHVLESAHREGPWVTPRSYDEFMTALHQSESTPNRIEFRTNTVINTCQMKLNGQVEAIFQGGRREYFDKVICATGFRPEVRNLPMDDQNIWSGRVVNGLPILEDDYCLKGLPELYFMGHFAQLGPRGMVDSILHHSQYAIHTITESIKCKEECSYVSNGRTVNGRNPRIQTSFA